MRFNDGPGHERRIRPGHARGGRIQAGSEHNRQRDMELPFRIVRRLAVQTRYGPAISALGGIGSSLPLSMALGLRHRHEAPPRRRHRARPARTLRRGSEAGAPRTVGSANW